jgi:hypothetical protein
VKVDVVNRLPRPSITVPYQPVSFFINRFFAGQFPGGKDQPPNQVDVFITEIV